MFKKENIRVSNYQGMDNIQEEEKPSTTDTWEMDSKYKHEYKYKYKLEYRNCKNQKRQAFLIMKKKILLDALYFM